jgi:Secretion system C-terminal sorting domain
MSKIFSFSLVFITILFPFNATKGQPDHFAYAMTAVNKGGSEWIALRKLDTRTGEFSNILLSMQDKDLMQKTAVGLTAAGSSVAAIAYDRKSNRLYYTPMNIDQLRFIDLSRMESFAVSDQFFSKAGNYDFKNAGPINRMVIAPDGFGYTITNDGTHLIRFTTNGSPALTDLGDLVDDPLNKEMSVHSICANSGGDLVADDAGHLYLVTGSNKVFKVDIASRVASYLATVSGLPQKFTTSGAAVSEDGKQIIVSSSTYSDACFLIDPETWSASPSPFIHEMFESADLANSNSLVTKNSGLFISKNTENLNRIRVFPNPVLDDVISIQFNQIRPGNYTIQLSDAFGKKVIQQKVTITGISQTEIMHIPHYTAQGFYYIRILDERNNVAGSQKLAVERW